MYANWCMSAWWLPMAWHLVGVRPSATTMLTWLLTSVSHELLWITWGNHTYNIRTMKLTILERSRHPFISLSLAGPSSIYVPLLCVWPLHIIWDDAYISVMIQRDKCFMIHRAPSGSTSAGNHHDACYTIFTHLPLNKMAAISQTMFSNAFSLMKKTYFWLKFHWSLFWRFQLIIAQHRCR